MPNTDPDFLVRQAIQLASREGKLTTPMIRETFRVGNHMAIRVWGQLLLAGMVDVEGNWIPSPNPIAKGTVVDMLKDGKRLRLAEWPHGTYIQLLKDRSDPGIYQFYDSAPPALWRINQSEILSERWEVAK